MRVSAESRIGHAAAVTATPSFYPVARIARVVVIATMKVIDVCKAWHDAIYKVMQAPWVHCLLAPRKANLTLWWKA